VTHSTAAIAITRDTPSARLRQAASERLAALKWTLRSPERWVFLSACDWYPDDSGYPTNLAALAHGDEAAAR
jgi:hypothetical protein